MCDVQTDKDIADLVTQAPNLRLLNGVSLKDSSRSMFDGLTVVAKRKNNLKSKKRVRNIFSRKMILRSFRYFLTASQRYIVRNTMLMART